MNATPSHPFPATEIDQPDCPECQAERDSLYGFEVLIRTEAFDAGLVNAVVVKHACWSCGYHRAVWVEVGRWHLPPRDFPIFDFQPPKAPEEESR